METRLSRNQRKRRLAETESTEVPTTSSEPQELVEAGSSASDTRPSKRSRISDVDTKNKDDQYIASTIPNNVEELSTMVVDTVEPSHQSSFVKLPPDVLFEILVLTGSPEYVLSVMRTCKSLFSVLFHPDAQWVWKETRKRVIYDFGTSPIPSEFASWDTKSFALPEPPASFFRSEVGYASFVFDGGACQVCGKINRCTYRSYSLRFRICGDAGCLRRAKGLLSSEPPDPRFSDLMYYEESPNCFSQDRTATHVHLFAALHFRSDQYASVRKYYCEVVSQPNSQATLAQKQALVAEWMEFCTKVYRWKEARHIVAKRTRETNRSKALQYASLYGWDKSHLHDCPTFQTYSNWKSRVFEELEDRDVAQMKEAIESELLAFAERQSRRVEGATINQNRADIEVLYNSLRSKPANKIFLPLSVFRKLPVLELLQSTEPPPSKSRLLSAEKKSKKPQRDLLQALEGNIMISKMISVEINAWVQQAKDDLAVVLGFPKNWKSASKLVLHPVERLTARWVCIKCAPLNGDGYANKWRMEESLDFEGVCKHDCGKDGLNVQGRKAKNSKKIEWKAPNYQKDEKAVQVLKKWLEMKNMRDDSEEGISLFEHNFAVICKSCDPPMVLDCQGMIAHSHRHDSMEIDANPGSQEVNLLLGGFKYSAGIAERFLGPSSKSKSSRDSMEKKIYGCRHCMRKKQCEDAKFLERINTVNQDSAKGVLSNVTLSQPTKPKPFEVARSAEVVETVEPLFSFHGLRSHMKARHFIPRIHDEDFYLQEQSFVPA